MSAIHFKTTLYAIGPWIILRLPQPASAQLPSRGQVMVKGRINDAAFHTALEPDGNGSHWLALDKQLQKTTGAGVDDTVAVTLEPTKDWPEPAVPPDVRAALAASTTAQALWAKITPMARWEWLRWIGATSQAETRKRRIAVACSKLQSGMRRPCCFNRSMCCVPEVSKNGVLLDPA